MLQPFSVHSSETKKKKKKLTKIEEMAARSTHSIKVFYTKSVSKLEDKLKRVNRQEIAHYFKTRKHLINSHILREESADKCQNPIAKSPLK